MGRTILRTHRLRALAVLTALVLVGGFLFLRLPYPLAHAADDLHPGMSRADVEAVLGEAYITLNKPTGELGTMVWINQLWQVSVSFDDQEQVERVAVTPADSTFRRMQNGLRSIF